MDTDNEITDTTPLVDFANKVEDKSKNIIKVVGVGGGGCNAVGNMYKEGIVNVTFAVCNTDTQALAKSEVPVKIPLGELGAGGDPSVGLEEARKHTDEIKQEKLQRVRG
jgi:cell division protein FtsZ